MIRPLDLERPLEWSDAFSVGHPVLDLEVRGLMESINNFRTTRSKDSVELRRVLFHSLALFAQNHFEHEDSILHKALMTEFSACAAPASRAMIEKCINAHAGALARLRAIGEDIVNASADDMPRYYAALKSWFAEHAVSDDARLKWVYQIQ